MKNNFIAEILTSGALIVVLFIFLEPSPLLMPMTTESMFGLFFLLLFLVFAALFWKEGSKDEREDYHRLNAGRISFFVGASFLTVGIFLQSLSHDIDPWLIYTLIAMIFAKISARIYSQIKH